MLDQSMIDTLIGAASDGRWERLIGAILLVLVALVRYVTRDRFSLETGQWISAVSALAGGVGAALLAGTVWWHALLIGLVVAPGSRGFWDRIRDLLPKREIAPLIVVFFLSLSALSGCSGSTGHTNRCAVAVSRCASELVEACMSRTGSEGVEASCNIEDRSEPEE